MILLLLGAAPADFAPGAPDLLEAERRLRTLLGTAEAVGAATSRLQVAWTTSIAPKEVCSDAARLEIGWRVERFGAAWREAAQAVRVQAERVRRMRGQGTVAPLVDERWAESLDALYARSEVQGRSVLEASAWQVAYVRPVLGACVVAPLAPAPGIAMTQVAARGEDPPPIAVLAMGDGWVCGGTGAVRADDAVVVVEGPACWSAGETCGCTPVTVEPGAVLGDSMEP